MLKLKSNFVCKKICFLNEGYRLEGHLHLPRRKKPSVVIGSHGLLATQDSPKQIALAHACNLKGMGFFRFDHRGCGQSEGGESERFSFEARCRDLLKACETMREIEETGDAVAVFGSSLGGAVACRVSSILKPKAIVTFAAPVSIDCIFDSIQKHSVPMELPRSFLKSLAFDNQEYLSHIQNIMVVHGDNDEVVPVSEALKIFRIAGNPKKLMIQKNGDHRMSSKTHQDEFVQAVAEWFNKGFENS